MNLIEVFFFHLITLKRFTRRVSNLEEEWHQMSKNISTYQKEEPFKILRVTFDLSSIHKKELSSIQGTLSKSPKKFYFVLVVLKEFRGTYCRNNELYKLRHSNFQIIKFDGVSQITSLLEFETFIVSVDRYTIYGFEGHYYKCYLSRNGFLFDTIAESKSYTQCSHFQYVIDGDNENEDLRGLRGSSIHFGVLTELQCALFTKNKIYTIMLHDSVIEGYGEHEYYNTLTQNQFGLLENDNSNAITFTESLQNDNIYIYTIPQNQYDEHFEDINLTIAIPESTQNTNTENYDDFFPQNHDGIYFEEFVWTMEMHQNNEHLDNVWINAIPNTMGYGHNGNYQDDEYFEAVPPHYNENSDDEDEVILAIPESLYGKYWGYYDDLDGYEDEIWKMRFGQYINFDLDYNEITNGIEYFNHNSTEVFYDDAYQVYFTPIPESSPVSHSNFNNDHLLEEFLEDFLRNMMEEIFFENDEDEFELPNQVQDIELRVDD